MVYSVHTETLQSIIHLLQEEIKVFELEASALQTLCKIDYNPQLLHLLQHSSLGQTQTMDFESSNSQHYQARLQEVQAIIALLQNELNLYKTEHAAVQALTKLQHHIDLSALLPHTAHAGKNWQAEHDLPVSLSKAKKSVPPAETKMPLTQAIENLHASFSQALPAQGILSPEEVVAVEKDQSSSDNALAKKIKAASLNARTNVPATVSSANKNTPEKGVNPQPKAMPATMAQESDKDSGTKIPYTTSQGPLFASWDKLTKANLAR